MAEKKEPMFRIRIAKNSKEDGDVFIAPNLTPMLIKRGVEVIVGQSVLDVLNDAIQTNVSQGIDEHGNQCLDKFDSNRIQYTVLGPAA